MTLKPILSNSVRSGKLVLATTMVAALTACASSPTRYEDSKIPPYTDQVTSKKGVFSQPVKWAAHKPGCVGDCPEITIDSLAFPGNQALTTLVDQQLALMTGIGEDVPAHNSIQEFITYFWEHADSRDEVVFSADTRYRNADITTLELGSYQYFTGAAHGISATQFVNWDNQKQKVLSFNDIVLPGKEAQFMAVLKAAHTSWLQQQEAYQDNPQQYLRVWPFQSSQNIGLSDAGVVVKYNSYEIAPYSSGQPELLLPYQDLQGILIPTFLPKP